MLNPFGSGTGWFDIGADSTGSLLGDPGWIRLDEARMKSTFRFWFSPPPPPLEVGRDYMWPTGVGFVSFVEAVAAGAGVTAIFNPPDWGAATATVTTDLASASAGAAATYFGADSRDDPAQGWYRNGALRWVDLKFPSFPFLNLLFNDYDFLFSGSASASSHYSAVSACNAHAQTGVVVMSGVDPLGLPEVGDNEFVFKGEGTAPRLTIPVAAAPVGLASLETQQWLAANLDWNLERPFAQTYLTRLQNGLIMPVFQSFGFVLPGLIYQDTYLPASNSAFGKNKAMMQWQGAPVHTANIEVFYRAQDHTHPPGGPPGVNWLNAPVATPNYIYYYSQLYDSSNVIYQNYDVSHYNWWRWPLRGDTVVYVADQLAAIPHGLPLFTRPPGGVIAHRRNIDFLWVRGVHAYVKSVEHERGHMSDFMNNALGGSPDTDGDDLSDAYEMANGLIVGLLDTTGLYAGAQYGDQEVSANIQAHGALMAPGVRELWQRDWAAWTDPNMCIQYGSPVGVWQPFPQAGQRIKPIPWEYGAAMGSTTEPAGLTYLRTVTYP